MTVVTAVTVRVTLAVSQRFQLCEKEMFCAMGMLSSQVSLLMRGKKGVYDQVSEGCCIALAEHSALPLAVPSFLLAQRDGWNRYYCLDEPPTGSPLPPTQEHFIASQGRLERACRDFYPGNLFQAQNVLCKGMAATSES